MGISPITGLSITDMTAGFASGSLSPIEVTQALLAAIEQWSCLEAFYYVDGERALDLARGSEQRWRTGSPRGELDGVPVSVKDHIYVQNMPVTWGAAGSNERLVPEQSSCAVDRLCEAGAIIVGKTSMAELGYYASGVSSRYPAARNPWDLTRTPGGSSSGAAAAVAAGLGPLAIGSDGGGSIRMPASFSGIVGLKPTGGRVPSYPSFGYNPVIGPLTRTVADAAIAFRTMAQPDRRDFFALPFKPQNGSMELSSLRSVRAAYLPEIGYGEAVQADVAAATEGAVEALRREGLRIETIPPPFEIDVYDAVADAILPTYCQRFVQVTDGDTEKLLPWSRQALAYSLTIPIGRFIAGSTSLARAVATFGSLFESFDFVITPTMTRTAFGADEPFPSELQCNRFGYAFDFASFVYIVNLCALPACSVPCGVDRNGLPIGLQIIGKRFDDEGVLQMAALHERLSAKVPFPVLSLTEGTKRYD